MNACVLKQPPVKENETKQKAFQKGEADGGSLTGAVERLSSPRAHWSDLATWVQEGARWLDEARRRFVCFPMSSAPRRLKSAFVAKHTDANASWPDLVTR